MYTDNNPLTYILTTAKLDATGQRWVASLANHNFKIFYKSGKLKCKKDLILKNGLLYQRTNLKNHPELVVQFVLPKRFIHPSPAKVILACHDDNGCLGMEQTLGLLQERFFWPKMAEDV